MSWTDERVETLKRMWSEGQSASQIAKELGGVTRNAVIGKVHRLGLSNRVGGPGMPDGPEGAEGAGDVAEASPQRGAGRTETRAEGRIDARGDGRGDARAGDWAGASDAHRAEGRADARVEGRADGGGPVAGTGTGAASGQGSGQGLGSGTGSAAFTSVGGGAATGGPGAPAPGTGIGRKPVVVAGQPLPPQPSANEISPEALASVREVEKKARRIGLMELTERTCKWPIGDPASDDFWFCGLSAKPGKPYCEAHVGVAFQPMSSRRDRRR